MAPVIRIPDDVFRRLQRHAVPFEDTPASVIGRLLDFYDSETKSTDSIKAKNGISAKSTTEIAREAVRAVGLTLAPQLEIDFRFSKIIRARIGDTEAGDWADLYRLAHRIAFKHFGSLEALKQQVPWEIANGKKRSKGFEYGYINEFGFSVRGVDAGAAWKRSRLLAELCRLPISVTVLGADNKKTILEWAPS